ncbi:hypothetical protein Scep_011945 [Stephania cephalantha]|uniref:Uncharacterized protein n=1 Tax=Stephania cephalantha TaxID=152367 RepID=A0AAP0JE74_9MAGN
MCRPEAVFGSREFTPCMGRVRCSYLEEYLLAAEARQNCLHVLCEIVDDEVSRCDWFLQTTGTCLECEKPTLGSCCDENRLTWRVSIGGELICDDVAACMTCTKTTSSIEDTVPRQAIALAEKLRWLLIENQRSWDGKLMTLMRDPQHKPRMYKGGSFRKTPSPVPHVESYSSDSSEEDREQVVEEEDSIEQESEEENEEEDGEEGESEGNEQEDEQEEKEEEENEEKEDIKKKRRVYSSKWSEKGPVERPLLRSLSKAASCEYDGRCGCRDDMEGVAPGEGDRAFALKMADEVLKHLTIIGAPAPLSTPTSGNKEIGKRDDREGESGGGRPPHGDGRERRSAAVGRGGCARRKVADDANAEVGGTAEIGPAARWRCGGGDGGRRGRREGREQRGGESSDGADSGVASQRMTRRVGRAGRIGIEGTESRQARDGCAGERRRARERRQPATNDGNDEQRGWRVIGRSDARFRRNRDDAMEDVAPSYIDGKRQMVYFLLRRSREEPGSSRRSPLVAEEPVRDGGMALGKYGLGRGHLWDPLVEMRMSESRVEILIVEKRIRGEFGEPNTNGARLSRVLDVGYAS